MVVAAHTHTTTPRKKMNNIFSRSALLLSENGISKLKNSHVAVFGIGGVGGHICEALVRCGVGSLTIVDADTVSESNINRQIVALHSTIGKLKTDVFKERALDINPDVKIYEKSVFFEEKTLDLFDFSEFDYVADAIDTVTSKLLLAEICNEKNISIISSMGTGNKLNPSLFEICDISKTSVCPLARVMRTELRKREIKHLKVLYSKEEPIKVTDSEQRSSGRPSPGSVSFVPSVAGLMIAGEIIKDLLEE